MEQQNKKIVYIGIISLAVILFGFVVWWQLDFNKKPAAPKENIAVEPRLMTVQSAESLARNKAKEWDAAAKLSKINSVAGSTSDRGRADSWELLFTSENKKGTAYRVNLIDKKVGESMEIPYFGEGGALPQNLLTSEEVIAKVRQIGGYENEPIVSVEMIYDKEAKLWFWGVKTGKGTITVNAQK